MKKCPIDDGNELTMNISYIDVELSMISSWNSRWFRAEIASDELMIYELNMNLKFSVSIATFCALKLEGIIKKEREICYCV